jgi:flagellar M-ring protein FliF
VGVQGFLQALERFGVGRLAAIAGSAFGLVAVLVMLMTHVGGDAKSLLYSNLDLKEASQITGALDAAGIKYEVKGDGTTIMVDRDKVAQTRVMLSSKGLPTSGSVGYEIFDSAPALGQTDFVQNINAKRAAEGELARTIRSIQGVSQAKVLLNIPKRALFEQDQDEPSASVMVETAGRKLTADQVRAIRNLVAAATPNLKPTRVAITDQTGAMLAGMDDPGAAGGAVTAEQSDVEERIKRQVRDLVEGVVGAGKVRVTVAADLDKSRVTTQEEKFDPDGQVVRSTATGSDVNKEDKPSGLGGVTASQNIPGAQNTNGSQQQTSASNKTEETTNYEISKSVKTTVVEPGQLKKLSVSVAVDGITPVGANGKPGQYQARSAEEMQRIEALVRAAVGFDEKRGDQLQVVNVRFERAPDAQGAPAGAGLDKGDIMRIAELAVMVVVTGLLMFFVVRPMLRPGVVVGPGGTTAPAGRPMQLSGSAGADGITPATPIMGAAGHSLAIADNGFDQKIDIAKIEGQVKVSSVKKVSEFIENHPEESISILRSWLHEG